MATNSKLKKHRVLPDSFEQLVRMMPPMAIQDDVHHVNTLEIIDRLMQIDELTQGQSDYLETLVELVEVYEAKNHAFKVSNPSGTRMLGHILVESGISKSELARLLRIHPSMGSKLLKGERRLTWDHAKLLGARFKVAPALFMD
jgi:antitoxin component HigA of HigAB toxin-antitoxin module